MHTPAQIERFWQDGFLSGLRVLSVEQAARARAHLERLEDLERTGVSEDSTDSLNRLLTSLSTLPAVVALVRDLLGGLGGIRNGDVFIKEPGCERQIGWHLDTAVPWPACRGLVNTWLALSPSTPSSGCMQVLPGLHRAPLAEGPRDKESLTLTEEAVEALDTTTARDLPLEPGCLSVHHFATPHRSGWNQTADRRVGLVTRWVGAEVTPAAAETRQLFPVGGPLPEGFSPRSALRIGWRSNRGA